MADMFFAVVLSLLAIFLILLVLVQRGRGGGLAGALGGMGGSSAFGAKAGDVFTRITIIAASIWIGLCLVAFFWAKHSGDALSTASPPAPPASSSPLNPAPLGQPGGRTATGAGPAEAPGNVNQPAATNGAATPTTPANAGASNSASPSAENP